MNQKGFSNVKIGVIAIVLLVVVGVYFLIVKEQEIQKQGILPQTVDTTDSNTSDWQNYHDEDFAISFQYPPDFQVQSSQDRLRIGNDYQEGRATKYIELTIMKRPETNFDELKQFFSAVSISQLTKSHIGKNNDIEAIKAVFETGSINFYVVGNQFTLQIGDTVNFHQEFLEQEKTYDYYRTQFDVILDTLELSFSEQTIPDDIVGEKKQKPMVSERKALSIAEEYGLDIDTEDVSIKLKSPNPSLRVYTGPGSPIRIQGQYWEIRIPIVTGPKCWTSRVVFIDAKTGEFYDLGKSESCI